MNYLENFFQVASTKQKRQLTGIATLFVVGAIFGTSALVPPNTKVTGETYQAVSAGPFPGRDGTPLGQDPGPFARGLVTSYFKVEFGTKIKSQRVSFKKIIYYTEKGKKLGEVPITSVTRAFKGRKPSKPLPKGTLPEAPASEAVTGKLFLWPLEGATLSIVTVSQSNFELKPDDRIYAEIKGRSGLIRFTIKTPVGPASGAPGFPH
ncbi:MAG: hypothetical protein ABIS18_09500 [Actinomycetota bacterium]